MARILPILAVALSVACTEKNSKEASPAPKTVKTVKPKTSAPKPRLTKKPKLPGPGFRLSLRRFQPPDVPAGFAFHGWSKDGTRYAFEVFEPAEGADCGDRYALYVVDANNDSFVGKPLTMTHESPEPGPEGCKPKMLVKVFDKKRSPYLLEHGIISGNLVAPVPFEPTGDAWSVRLSNGKRVDVEFEVLHPMRDPYEDTPGAAYRLVLGRGEQKQIVEPGKRRRKGVMRYQLKDGMVFERPGESTHLALIIQVKKQGFEGGRWTWMSNGVRLLGR